MKNEIMLCISILVLVASSIIVGLILGSIITHSEMKEQAVKAGVAYYTNNPTGSPEFCWKTNNLEYNK